MAISTDQIATELKKIKASNSAKARSREYSQPLAKLAAELQTTINLDELLAIFSQQLADLVAHSGLNFSEQSNSIHILQGQRSHHSCEYTLSIEDSLLGTLRLMRRKRFTEVELEGIEHYLSALLYPLKNALLYRQAIQLAHTDPLTGVLNRSTLQSVFQKEGAISKRQHSGLSLLMLDIDWFKSVNDTYGHHAGDLALKTLTQCIQETARESDHIFRLGGEEFAILLNSTDLAGAHLLAERLRIAVEALQVKHEQHCFNFTVSIGLTAHIIDESLESTMQRADKALYSAKQSGRNKVISA